MRKTKIFLSGGLLLAAAHAIADDEFPDIKYGMWETTSTTTISSEAMTLPEQTYTSSSCVTEEEVKKGQAFLNDMDNCEILEKTMTSTSADLSLVCDQPEVGETTMNLSMQYDGDTMTGAMTGEMNGPMGKVDMRVQMSGKRIGEC